MTKKTKEELALEAYLAGLTEKKAQVSDKYIVNHNNAMKELAVKRKTDTEWQLDQSKRIKAERADAEKKEQWQKALKDGWNKPGVRENKSQSVREVLSRPGQLKAHQERARKNGRKSMRPCVSPEGVFESNRAWAEHTAYSRDLFGYRCRKMPTEYYYITQEEYTMLTGKEI